MSNKLMSLVLPGSEEHHLLTLAALFGDYFTLDWLLALTARKASQTLEFLEKAVQDGILVRREIGSYCFKSIGLKHEMINQLDPKEKEQFHIRISNLLLSEVPDNDGLQAVAYHLLQVSNNDVEKCRWLVRAGDAKLRSYRNEEALHCYIKAINDLRNLQGQESDHILIDAALKYSKISTARHDTEGVLSILQDAILAADRSKERKSHALLEMHIAKNEWLRSRYTKALRHFEKGWSEAKKLNDPRLLRSATTFSTFFLYWQGRFREAVQNYEKSVPDIENYPEGGYPLLATLLVGYCYGLIGQVSQGLGMLDSIRKHCLERGNEFLAAWGGFNMGAIMLDIMRVDDALQYLERAMKEAEDSHNDFIRIQVKPMLSLANYLKGNHNKAIKYLDEFKLLRSEVNVTVNPYPFLMELCLAMEERKLPQIAGFSLNEEVRRMIKGGNICLKGVAYRYKALIEKQNGSPREKIIRELKHSIKWLEASGNQIQLARSQFDLARQYLPVDKAKAERITRQASKAIFTISDSLIPDDIRSLIKETRVEGGLLREIFKLGQEVVTIRNNKDLVHHIISTVNRLTGAERGAIFLLDEGKGPHEFRLRASKNLTSEEINNPNFGSSLDMVKEVAFTGKGQILEFDKSKESPLDPSRIVRSRICVPMIFRNKTVGVLYHDNRLLSSAFRESDLELLAYFAGMAAFAFDNSNAYEEIKELNKKLNEEKLYYQEQALESIHFEDIVGESHAIYKVLEQVNHVCSTDASVLILGETGVGKELVARAIHRNSPRRGKSFIRVHCSALPESLIPSELFGHEKGAFTGATRQRIGRFELADRGTLFLDEIGDLSLEIQVRLLRVLQTREFERVGGSETLNSDFRLLAATNRDLEEEINAHRFRMDLYYRINVFPIYVPPLRKRKDDIPLLANYFLRIYANKLGRPMERISKTDLNTLMDYDWPGNIRELENIIERGIILSQGHQFRLPEQFSNTISETKGFHHKTQITTLNENEREYILRVLKTTAWKIRGPDGAAELLNIHPSTLAFRMKKLGIHRPAGIPKKRSKSVMS